MKGRWTTALFGAAAVLLIAAVVCIAFFLRAGGETPEVHLAPEAAQPEPTLGVGPEAGDDGLDRVEVRPDTVQAVIASLARPESYRRELDIETFWPGGDAQWHISAEVEGENAAINITGAQTRSIRLEGRKLTVWYEDPGEVYEAELDETELAARLQDEFQMLYTYEDILALPQQAILSAEYGEWEGLTCIRVETRAGELNYRTVWYVSVESGLLERAETWDGETLVYRLNAEM